MEFTVLFLISCVLIARKFEKQKMEMASLAYSITFVFIMIVLLFTVDIDIVRRGMINIFGDQMYMDVRGALMEALNMAYYGVTVVSLLTVTAIVQFIIAALDAARAVVRHCFPKKSVTVKFKKVYPIFNQIDHSLHLPKRINLIYCRILN